MESEDDDVKTLSNDIFLTLQTYLQNENVEVEIRFCTFYPSNTRKVNNYQCNKKWQMYRFHNNERHRIDVGVSKKDFETIKDKLTLSVGESEQIVICNKDDNSKDNNGINSNKSIRHMKTLEVHENGLRYVFAEHNESNDSENNKSIKATSKLVTNKDIINTINNKYAEIGEIIVPSNSISSAAKKEMCERLSNQNGANKYNLCNEKEKSRRYEELEEWQLISVDKKKKLCVYDICICNKKYDIRLAVNVETPISCEQKSGNDCNSESKSSNGSSAINKEASASELKEHAPLFVKPMKVADLSARSYRRTKERWTFCRGNANVDLTVVNVNNKQSYEVEVEWNAGLVKGSEMTKEHLYEFIINAIKLLDETKLVGNSNGKLSTSPVSITSVEASQIHNNSKLLKNNSSEYYKRPRWNKERCFYDKKQQQQLRKQV